MSYIKKMYKKSNKPQDGGAEAKKRAGEEGAQGRRLLVYVKHNLGLQSAPTGSGGLPRILK